MRLTKYEPSKDSMFPYRLRDEEPSTELDATHKLGRLEDAEELCEKIVSQPIYEKNNTTGEIREINYEDYTALYDFKKRRIEIHDWDYVDGFDLDDYGINWALTKEELL